MTSEDQKAKDWTTMLQKGSKINYLDSCQRLRQPCCRPGMIPSWKPTKKSAGQFPSKCRASCTTSLNRVDPLPSSVEHCKVSMTFHETYEIGKFWMLCQNARTFFYQL